MITILLKKNKIYSKKNNNDLSQTDYDRVVDALPFHALSCECSHTGHLIKHGFYKRSIKTSTAIVLIRVLRMRCKCCGKTHAILPEWIVPFSLVPLKDHINIISTYLKGTSLIPIMEANLCLDESNIRYIIRQFKFHWEERLKAFRISYDGNLVEACFHNFTRQFMQIKRTSNILFLQTT